MLPRLPLEQMTTLDKLMALEQIWEDLLRNAEDIASPEWHEEVLAARKARVESGEAKFEGLAAVKAELRERFEC